MGDELATPPCVHSGKGPLMALRLAQESRPAGENWKWSVWLTGTDEDLDTVSSVRYILHSTFKNPVREIADRDSSFRLQSSGWGEFRIFAHVQVPGQPLAVLSAWLHLFEPDRRRVFISARSSDSELIENVAETLAEQGLEVLGAVSGLTLGDAFEGKLVEAVYTADAVVAIVGDRGSPWVEEELTQAEKAGIPIYVVVASSDVDLPPQLSAHAVHLATDRNDLDTLAMEIRDLRIVPGEPTGSNRGGPDPPR